VLEVFNTAGWVVGIVRALGKETETANTTHDAWRWKNVKKKNDPFLHTHTTLKVTVPVIGQSDSLGDNLSQIAPIEAEACQDNECDGRQSIS